MIMIDDDCLINIYCWRCKEPILQAVSIEPATLVICSCNGITRLPELRLTQTVEDQGRDQGRKS